MTVRPKKTKPARGWSASGGDQRPKTLPSFTLRGKSKIFHRKILVYGLWSMVYGLVFTGCVTVSAPGVSRRGQPSASDFIEIDSFCKEHNFQYDFDTLDDIVSITCADKEIRLILNSLVGYFNGSIFCFNNSPYYAKGKIYLPRELETILFTKEDVTFKPPYSIKTIVIDPGHGGKDPGAVSISGIYEKNLNLRVSQSLKRELEKQGFRVVLTRSADVFLSLEERVAAAKKCNADLFISIHANSNHSSSVKGVEVYYMSSSRFNSQLRAAQLVKADKFWSDNLPSDAKVILWDLLLTKNYDLSVEVGHNLYHSFRNLGFKIKLPKNASFYVLKTAYVPAVLVEMGYLSNRYEEKMLKSHSYQKQICEAITLGVVSLNKRYASFVQDSGSNLR